MLKSKIVIILNNVQSQIHGLVYKDFQTLRKACGWRDKGYFFTDAYQTKGWDGYTSLLTKNGKFPTGIYEVIIKNLDDLNIPYKLFDKRTKIEIDETKILNRLKNLNIVIRPYQINGAMIGFKEQFMLFEWPTASGKAVLFAILVLAYNLRTLIIVNRKELMYQISKEIMDKTDLEVGIIGDKYPGTARSALCPCGSGKKYKRCCSVRLRRCSLQVIPTP